MILLLALWEAATQPTNFLFHQPHYKPHKKGGRKEISSPEFFVNLFSFILCLHQQACNPSHPASLLPLPHLLCVHHLQHLPVGQSSSPQLRYSCLILRRRDGKIILAPRSTNWKSAESCEPPPPSPPTPSQTPPHQTSSLPLPDTPASVGSKVVPRMIWKHSWQSQRRSRRSKRRGRLRSREQLCRWRGTRSEPSGNKMPKTTCQGTRKRI